MSKLDLTMLPPWEQLFKRVLWAQLGDLRGKRILDFGSGIGVTACHYAAENEVIAVEPSAESVAKRWDEHPCRQIIGSIEALRQMEDGSFDVIFCHNVLEYVPDRAEVLKEFHRLLKPEGFRHYRRCFVDWKCRHSGVAELWKRRGYFLAEPGGFCALQL